MERISRFLPRSVRGMLLLLLLVIFVPWALVDAVHHYSLFSEQRDHELQHNLELARSVTATFNAYIDDIHHQELAVGKALASPQVSTVEQANGLLAASAREYPPVRHYSWVNPQGRVIASSHPEAVGLEIGDLPYFREISGGREWTVSELFPAWLASAEPIFIIARGIRNEEEALQGVVIAAIKAGGLGEVLRIERAGEASISIIDRQGRLVYRYPEVDLPWEGRNVLEAQPFIAPSLAGEEVSGTFTTMPDGQRRVASYVPIGSTGWAAGAGRLEEQVMAPVIRELGYKAGQELLVAIGALLAALAVGRNLTTPVRRLREHVLSFGHGELSQRVAVGGPAEVRELATAFNQMADTVEARTQELGLVIDAMRTISSASNLDAALQELAAKLARTINVPVCRVALLAEGGRVLVVRASYSAIRPGRSPFLGVTFPIDEVPPARQVIDSRQVVEVESPESDLLSEGERERWKSAGVASALGVPLIAQDEVIGLLSLGDVRPRKFSEQEKSLCLAVGQQVAVVIDRVALSQQIAAERERLTVTMRSIGDGVIVADTEGKVVLVNRVAEELTNWTQEEALGRPLGEVFHIINEMTRELCEDPVRKALDTGGIVGLANHTALIARDGTERSIADSAAPIRDRDGNIFGVVLVFRDITTQRRAEEALMAQFKQFSTLFDSLNAAVYVADMETYELLFLNKYTADLFGADSIGRPCFQVLQSGQTGQCTFCTNDRLVQNGEPGPPYVWEFQNTLTGRWFLCIDKAIPWTDARLVRMEVAVDITERKLAEEERERLLTEIEHRAAELNTVIESIADGVFVCDSQGLIITVNQAGLELTGARSPEEERMLFSDCVARLRMQRLDGTPMPVEESCLAKALRGEVFHGYEAIWYPPGKERLYIQASGAPIRDEAGRIVGGVAVISDATRIRETDRLKDEFISIASHELRTPLTLIKGYSDTLLRNIRRRGEEGYAREAMEVISEEVDRMADMINKLLNVSRIQAGRLVLYRQPVDLVRLIEQRVNRAQATTTRHSIKTSSSAPALIGQWDEAYLGQVIDNLLQNAIKYGPNGGQIDVQVQKIDGEAQVLVRDEGMGIPPEKQAYLFQRFYRASEEVQSQRGGLGLGLYICHEVVSLHGGRMWVESEVGRGSSFYFTLPLA